MLELLPGQGDVVVPTSEGELDRSALQVTQRSLRLLRLSLAGVRLRRGRRRARVTLGVGLRATRDEPEDRAVPVNAAEVAVAVRRQYIEDAVFYAEDCDVESSAAEIVDEHISVIFVLIP